MSRVIEWHVKAMSHDGIYEVEFIYPSELTNAKEVRKAVTAEKDMFDIKRVISVKKAYFQPAESEEE